VEQEFKNAQLGSTDKGIVVQDLLRQKEAKIQELQAEIHRLKLEHARDIKHLSLPRSTISQTKDASICLQVRTKQEELRAVGL